MQHMILHLPMETRLGGPVQNRWCYSTERMQKTLRAKCKNKRRIEASMAEAFITVELFTINLISYNNFVTMTISHHMPCKNKLDASKLSLQVLRGFGLPRKEPILPMNKNH